MTTLRVAAIGVIASVFATGCLTLPSPTPVVGPRDAVQSLAGEWTGYYVGKESRRSGAINFSLTAGDTFAYGDVVMVPREYAAYDVTKNERQHVVPPPILLQITFVQVADGYVSGMLEPYMEPDCDCLVVTTFTGRMTTNDKFEGRFTTRIVGLNDEQTGRWEVRRKKGR